MPRTIVDVIIDAVNKRQSDEAGIALRNPRDKTQFGYGEAHGYFRAMEDVKEIVRNVLDQEKNRE